MKKIDYKCSKCGKIESDDDKLEWCNSCEELTMEVDKKNLDTSIKKETYGVEHHVNCPNGCSELELTCASDVNFGKFTSDICVVYCPICRHEESVFSK